MIGVDHQPTATEIKALQESVFATWMRWLRQPVIEEKKVKLEDIVDLYSQTIANNEAMRKVIDFIVGERKDDG